MVGLDASGAVVMRRRMRRETLIGLAEKLPACVVGMEACCGSHHLVFASHGHDVREGERRGPPADDDPGLRPDCRVGARCRCRSSGKFQPRRRSCAIVRIFSTTFYTASTLSGPFDVGPRRVR